MGIWTFHPHGSFPGNGRQDVDTLSLRAAAMLLFTRPLDLLPGLRQAPDGVRSRVIVGTFRRCPLHSPEFQIVASVLLLEAGALAKESVILPSN